MWYAGSDELLGLGTLQIGYAWSLNGISWRRYARNPVLSPGHHWEAGVVVTPAVIKDGETFKMWYGAAGVPPRIIGYATSADGLAWNKHSDPVLQLGSLREWDGGIIGPGSIRKENEVYKMWYWAGQESWPLSVIQVGLAISQDGINWIKFDDPSTTEAAFSNSDPVLRVGNPGEWDQHRVWSPAVLATETGYEMWYAGRAGYTTPPQLVGYATSRDGITWQKSQDNPVIGDRPAWGFSYLTSSVLEFKGYYHLWFTSFPFANDGQRAEIGYAKSVSDSAAIASEPPSHYLLLQNHPNPFNGTTTLRYAVPERAEIVLEVYDVLGRRVKNLFRGIEEVGLKSVTWDGTDELNRPAGTGVYLYRIRAGEFSQTRKMVLLE
ncbi:MAG: T9SS type A sorting domain-containing protein [bacterium]